MKKNKVFDREEEASLPSLSSPSPLSGSPSQSSLSPLLEGWAAVKVFLSLFLPPPLSLKLFLFFLFFLFFLLSFFFPLVHSIFLVNRLSIFICSVEVLSLFSFLFSPFSLLFSPFSLLFSLFLTSFLFPSF